MAKSIFASFLFVILQLLTLKLVLGAKFDGADCFHEKSQTTGVCVYIKYCKSALSDLKYNQMPEMCRFEDNLPIICCPLQKEEEEIDTRFSPEDENLGNCYHQKSRSNGVCISIQNCKMAQKELELNQAPQVCKFEAGLPVVCCPRQGENALGLPSQIGKISEQKCLEYSEKVKKLPVDFAVRIVGGEEVVPGEFPHFVLLGYGNPKDPQWKCGGSLISENFVLTAGHCLLENEKVVKIQIGATKLNSGDPGKVFGVKKIYRHPDFVSGSSYNDVGLLELDIQVEFSSNIKPACLPKVSENDQVETGIVIGFGQTNFQALETSKTLQKASLTYFPNSKCSPRYKNDPKFPNGVLNPIQTCYGSKSFGKDACQGDSGGPFQYFDYNTSLHRVTGIVSLGIGCGNPRVPGIYTRVKYFISWIEEVVWKTGNGKLEMFQEENRPRQISVHKFIHNVANFG